MTPRWTILAGALLTVALVSAASAGAGSRRMPANETWKSECGACHVAYPPHLLPARSWQAIMGGLDKHFGSDARIQEPAASEIQAFLARHAGRRRDAAGSLRISTTPWFVRKHRDVPEAAWSRPAVKTRANCGACHPGAERGDFDDDFVAVPR